MKINPCSACGQQPMFVDSGFRYTTTMWRLVCCNHKRIRMTDWCFTKDDAVSEWNEKRSVENVGFQEKV